MRIEFSLYLFPGHTRFAAIALNCGSKFYEIFHVFETFLETEHCRSQ